MSRRTGVLPYGERVSLGRRGGLQWDTVIPSSIGASPLFSGAERYFRTESASPWVAGAASSGSREEELVERNASVALKAAGTSETRGVTRGKTHGVTK